MKNNGRHKYRMSVKRKITLLMMSSTLLIALIGISLGYYLGKNLLIETIGREHKQIAATLGLYITEALKGEIEDAQTYASTRPLWISAVKESNLSYVNMDKEAVTRTLLDMNKKWIDAANDSPLLKEYLDNVVSRAMVDIVNIRKTVSGILITDKFGGLVAASEKTNNFYQADKVWWQEAYSKGRGRIFVGDVELDESSKAWSIPIAVPVKDEAGEVMGVCRVVVGLERLVSGLRHFNIGNTGHAVLVDRNGNILVHYGLKPMVSKYYDGALNDLLNEKKSYVIMGGLHIHRKKIFTAFSKIDLTPISGRADHWIIFIDQDSDETLKPIRALINRITFVALTIVILIIPIGYIAGSIFVRPIEKLKKATEKILNGNWDYEINLKTGDEIEEFAGSFKEMRRRIKENQDALLSAKNSLEDLSKNLEKKVEERTKDLTETQEATLNVLEDLTEAKISLEKKARELEDAIRIKSDFTSMVSHELRTPLAAIKESIALILDGMAGDVVAEQRDFLNMAKRNVDRLARLINEILDFQKLESGKVAFNIKENDINEVAREVGSAMAALTKEKNIELVLDLSDHLPMLKFDRDKLVQVLTNLVDNAFKFTEKGSITIASAASGEDVLVSVSDTGSGIKIEDFPKLFQQFEQLEKGGGRKTGGTGLGLAISRQIIERHDGKIWVESQPGKGATFYFTLPIG